MKKILLALLIVVSFGCEEQQAESPTVTSPSIGDEYTPPPVYTGEIVPYITNVSDLGNTNIWKQINTGSPSDVSFSTNSLSFHPQEYGGYFLQSKFKTKGDIDNNGDALLSFDVLYTANSDNQFSIWFDFSTNYTSTISINFHKSSNTVRYTIYQVINGRSISTEPVSNFSLGVNTSDMNIPITVSRTSSTTITINVGGNITTLTEPEYSGDINVGLSISGNSDLFVNNFYTTDASYALFGGY